MKWVAVLVILCFTGLPSTSLHGQERSGLAGLPVLKPSYTNNFSTTRGLPQVCVSDVIPDRRGRLWVATCAVMATINSVRLFQFDGYDFYPINLANDGVPGRTLAILKQCLPSGELLGILEGETANAIFLFDPDRQLTSTLTFSQEGFVRDVAPETGGSFVALLEKEDSLLLYRVRDMRSRERITGWKKYDTRHPGRGEAYFGASLYVSGDEALIRYNGWPVVFQVNLRERHSRIYPLKYGQSGITEPFRSFSDRFHRAFLPTPHGELLCYFPNAEPQIFVRRTPGDAFEPWKGLPEGYRVCRIETDSAGNLLFLLVDRQQRYAGLLIDPTGRRYDYSAFVSGYSCIHNIHSINFLSSVFVCADDGLCYNAVGASNNISCILPEFSIRGMMELEPGRFLITTEQNTLLVYEAASGKITAQTSSSPLMQAFGAGSARNLQRSADGSIWGTRADLLVQYFPATGQHVDYPEVDHILSHTVLSDGRIAAFSREKGLEIFDPVTRRTTRWQSKNRLGAQGPFVHAIRQTRDGLLWVLTGSGLLRLDLQSGQETLLGFGPAFHDFRFVCMTEANDGKLWLGTFLGGIQIYDPKTGAVRVVDKNQGLPNNTVVQLLQDASGDLWAGTYKGLSRLSAEGTLQNNYLLSEGLCELEFNRFAALRARDGILLMGTIHGLHVIRPEGKKGQPGVFGPQIYLTALAVADPKTGVERWFSNGLDSLPTIVLPPERRYLHLRFALSNYAQPDRNQFAYMLKGKDETWIPIGDQHELTLNDLPAGRYTLLLRGSDFEGRWTETPVRIELQAGEFFYKQPWFYALCLLPLLALGWMWLQRLRGEKKRLETEVRRRTRQIQSDKELIEQQTRELMHLDEAKSRFFTNISHELRTPITLITAPVEQLLEKTLPDPDEQRQSLQRILYNGRKLAALVEELLELSRLEAGKAKLQETATAFYPYCRQIFNAFESQAQMKRIAYRLDYTADTEWRLAIDRRRLEKIINNLIANALKFTPPGGRVDVIVGVEPVETGKSALVVLRVEDSGRGIPPEDMPHLFERYFQTKRDDVAREGGAGIGLTLAKELAVLMNGDLHVSSVWGAGSTFTLTLPLPVATTTALPEPIAEPLPTPAPPATGRPLSADHPHLLIVEDNPDMRALLRSLLADRYRLTLADDGQDAWEILDAGNTEAQAPSLILSDVMMPRMDGYQLLEKIKSHARWQQLPVILLTARAEEQDKLQALRLGVDDYLVKPFSPPELLARVSNLIGNYRRRQTYFSKTVPDFDFEKVDSQAAIWLKSIETAAKTALDKGLPLQVATLAEAGAMSERQFFRAIKRVTGLTPNQYILEVRLQKARHLLQHRAYHTLAEVAYAVGFDTPGYFTRVFEQHFGKHPSTYLAQASPAP